MAMIPGCDYDLFVSYAHADNLINEEHEGWIQHFVSRLRAALGMRLGASKDLTVFCDSNVVEANSRLPDLLSATRKSAVFLAIGSPSYVSQKWPGRELAAFVEKHGDLERLFLVELLPLNTEQRYPPPLDENIHFDFWKPSGPRNIPVPLSIHADNEQYNTLIHTLAADLAKKLLSMRLLPNLAKVAPTQSASSARLGFPNGQPDGQPGTRRKAVLLAQSTEDVEDELEQLRSYLLQYGDEVSIVPQTGYPQGGADFKAAFQDDLANADLVVQLLGKRIGRMPPDLPQGYTRYQCELAKSSRVPLLQWRRPDIDPEACNDPAYQTILKSETVIASGFEAFKVQLLKEIRKGKEPPRQVKSSTVFINADDKDMEIAKEVERECLCNALPAILPMTGSSSEAIRRDLEENLIDCDVLVFIYGDTTQDWIRGQLRFFNKVRPKRESPPKLLAICSGPPPKPEIGISFPDAHVIDCPSGWDMAPIRKLILELG